MAKNKTGSGSLLREDASEGGGGMDGREATITMCRFIDDFNYGGTQDKESAALMFEFHVDGIKNQWKPDNWTLGPADKYEISDDGYSYTPKDGKGLSKASAAHFFFGHLQDAIEASGLEVSDVLGETDEGGHSVEPLEGRKFLLKRVPYTPSGGNGTTKDKYVIGSFVVEDEAPKAKSNGKAAVRGNNSGKIADKAIDAIKSIVEDKGTVKFGDLGQLLHKALRQDSDVKAILEWARKPANLSDVDEFTFNEKKGTLSASA